LSWPITSWEAVLPELQGGTKDCGKYDPQTYVCQWLF
jgi:hypothetical protein